MNFIKFIILQNIFRMFFLLFILFTSCKTYLIDENEIKNFDHNYTKSNCILYYLDHYTVEENGRFLKKNHFIIKIGSELKSLPEIFHVADGSMYVLKDFEARILHKDGSKKVFNKGDLGTLALSNRYQISERKRKYLPIIEKLSEGDFVEQVSIHELLLSPLGISFQIPEFGKYHYNVSCKIDIPSEDELNYRVINDTISPKIQIENNTKHYTFYWKQYRYDKNNNMYSRLNIRPLILASTSRYKEKSTNSIKSIQSWLDFGNWYLDLIQSKIIIDKNIKLLTKELIKDIENDKEKMDAIFEYCQKNIRYEQVYLEFGEIIPNSSSVIYNKKFGDCKDYATLIYTMAKCANLDPHFVLCYRNRRRMMIEEIPVSQFNHALIHFKYKGEDYWYDGTNRTGIPGLTTIDLLNQRALVIQKDSTRFLTIKESDNNKMSINGVMNFNKNNFTGLLKIKLISQYAIDFFLYDIYLNRNRMKEWLIDWIKDNINKDIVIKNLSWESTKTAFQIELLCEIPNAAITLDKSIYLSVGRIFNQIFPLDNPPNKDEEIYYFPFYNNIDIQIQINNLQNITDNKADEGLNLKLFYSLPPGPFPTSKKESFISNYLSIYNKLNKKYKLKLRAAL